MDWRKRQLQTALEDVARQLELSAEGSWIEFEGEKLVVLTAKAARYVVYVLNKTAEWISTSEQERIHFAPDDPLIEARLPRKESEDGEEAQGKTEA